jgi:NAD(P)H-hydrate epimerase
MKILTKELIHQADSYTIVNEPIASIDLMERASKAFVDELLEIVPLARIFCVVCGSGNNGGDGFAIARILAKQHYSVKVFHIQSHKPLSRDCTCNLERLQNIVSPTLDISIVSLTDISELEIPAQAIIIDAIFGSGLHTSIQGLSKECIIKLNALPNIRVAVDIPSGLYCDRPQQVGDTIFKAHYTITFQYPKLSFLFLENEQFVGDWSVVPIGLSKEFEEMVSTPYFFTMHCDVTLQSYSRFAHKGNKGHALIVAGSTGKTGAAVLAARACISSGCGLVTAHVPQNSNTIMQIAIPEVMTSIDEGLDIIQSIPNFNSISAIALGPGIGTHSKTQQALIQYISHASIPMVLDADALNIVSLHKEILYKLPQDTILTPHPGEFDRLTRKHESSFERLQTQIAFSKQTKCIVVLKGKYTSITLPNGDVWFNSTGNHGMATAGSGDTLTGIIVSLLAQGYTPNQASIYGVFIHGLAGDLALQTYSTESLLASSIITYLGDAFKQLNREML